MIRIDLTPPKAKGEKGAGDVIDLARARQERRSTSRAYFDDYHINAEKWRGVLCADGRVYIEILAGGECVAQIDMGAAELQDLDRDLRRLAIWQRRYNERQRGAHLWIARPHPERQGWFLVRHADREAPFRPVNVGPRRVRTWPDGRTYSHEMPKCDACSKAFTVGELAFEAEKKSNGTRPLGRARICQGCTRPPRDGLLEIEGGSE